MKDEPQSLSFSLDGPARTWQRAGSGNGTRYTPPEMREHAGELVKAAEHALLREGLFEAWPLERKYAVVVRVYRRRKDDGPGDASNYLKLVEDALQGVLWSDDKRLVSSRADKLHAQEERTEVHVRIVGSADELPY